VREFFFVRELLFVREQLIVLRQFVLKQESGVDRDLADASYHQGVCDPHQSRLGDWLRLDTPSAPSPSRMPNHNSSDPTQRPARAALGVGPAVRKGFFTRDRRPKAAAHALRAR
jgi:hypothetical protein